MHACMGACMYVCIPILWIHTHGSASVCGCANACVCTYANANAPAHDMAFLSPAILELCHEVIKQEKVPAAH